MQQYADVIIDPQGNVVAGAQVYILNSSGQIAEIFSSNSTNSPQANPIRTGSLGEFSFYARNGRYRIGDVVVGGKVFPAGSRDIILNDPVDNPSSSVDELANPDGAGKVGFRSRNVALKFSDIPSIRDYSSSASALIDVAKSSLLIPKAGDDSTLPSVYPGVMLEYLSQAPLSLTHQGNSSGVAQRTYKTQFQSAHENAAYSALHLEGKALGSGKNGPSSADTGLTINVHKKGYGGATDPLAGEVDGISIFVRNDGPKGQAAGSSNSADTGGILVNVQNVEDSGFIAVMEATTSNYRRSDNTTPYSIQTQIGVLDMNNTNVPSYGFVAIASRGACGHGLYVAKGSNGGTWANVLFAPTMVRIDSSGNYYALSQEWVGGAWTVTRPAGVDSATTFQHRGAGALALAAPEGAIQFSTNNAIQWEVTASGTFRRSSTNSVGAVGDPNRRVTVYAQKVDLSANGVSGLVILSGTGVPAIAAPVGSMYLRSDGGTGSTLYVKESGTGSAGWVAK